MAAFTRTCRVNVIANEQSTSHTSADRGIENLEEHTRFLFRYRCPSDHTKSRKQEATDAFGEFHTDIKVYSVGNDTTFFFPRLIIGRVLIARRGSIPYHAAARPQ
jgi:hypothetical protein